MLSIHDDADLDVPSHPPGRLLEVMVAARELRQQEEQARAALRPCMGVQTASELKARENLFGLALVGTSRS